MFHPSSLAYKAFQLCLALVILSGLSACKLFRKAENTNRVPAWVRVLNTTEARQLDFEGLSIQGKARISMPGSGLGNQSANYRIHIAKDSLIWIKITKLGFEGARVLVRPDSIFALDRLNRAVYRYDYSIAEEYTGLKADFGVLQDLLLGHFHPIPDSLFPVDPKVSPTTFSGEASQIQFDYQIDPTIFRLLAMTASHTQKEQASTIDYSDFESVEEFDFPMMMAIAVQSPDEMSFSFTHRKVQVNPSKLSFSFSVPASYE